MCPICLASLALTVASTTGAGAAATALALRVRRSLAGDDGTRDPSTNPNEEAHEDHEANRQP
jgi:hypothetical protein